MAKQSEATVEATNTLGYYLVVRHAFESYRKGDAIRDPDAIARILASDELARNVHKVGE